MSRFKKNFRVDSWPIEDTERGCILNNDDIVLILNNADSRIKELELELDKRKRQGKSNG
tara:strand:- start:140 stop:316 length:177 start_codon:yes stop_codon:yes gene_type:complete